MSHFTRLVRIIECPPRREESLEVYTENMTRAVRQLPSPLTCVIVVIKQNTISGGGFQLNKVCVSQSVSWYESHNTPSGTKKIFHRLINPLIGCLLFTC